MVSRGLRSRDTSKKPNRILAVLDTHPRSRDVRELALALSNKYSAHLTFTTTVPPCFPWATCAGISLPLPSAQELDDEARRLLALASQDIAYGLHVMTVVDRGFAVDALLRRIDLGAHDLVVLRRTATSLMLRRRTLTKVIEVTSLEQRL